MASGRFRGGIERRDRLRSIGSLKWLLPLALLAVAAMPGRVDAHGRGSPNLQKFCEAYFKFDKRPISRKVDKVRYYYDTKRRTWYCSITFPHFQKGTDTRVHAFAPSEACKWQFGTRHAHYHQGIDVRSVKSIDCGVRSGTVSADAGRKTLLSLCNRSRKASVFAAVAYWEPGRRGRGKGWTSRGWFKADRGRCRTIQIGDGPYKGNVYLYAEAGPVKWTGDEARFCIHKTDGFHIRKADTAPCSGSDYKRVRTTKFHVSPGKNSYNFRD